MRRSGLLRPRPPEVWTLAALYLGGGLGSLLGSLAPMSDRAPVRLGFVVAAACAALAAVVWLRAQRWGRPVLVVGALLGVGVVSLLVGASATSAGATVTAFAYVWIAVYAGHVLRPAEAWLVAGGVTVGYLLAMRANEAPDSVAAYVIVVATIWVAVTVLSNLVERMRRAAVSDDLTGLLNRAGFRDTALRLHAVSRRSGSPLTLVTVDLDGFKAVNDRQGHAAGDALLADVARSWADVLRASDVLARVGGDEFVLLLPGTPVESAERVLARMRAARSVGWSAGLASWGPDESLDACLSRADDALYAAKSGRTVDAGSGGGTRIGE
jgi:diguanylate cyclase (GGDEF)-like protein